MLKIHFILILFFKIKKSICKKILSLTNPLNPIKTAPKIKFFDPPRFQQINYR